MVLNAHERMVQLVVENNTYIFQIVKKLLIKDIFIDVCTEVGVFSI